MGTSTHNGGQKGGTPLVPSWLQDTDLNIPGNANPILQIGDPNRFTAPRGEFTRYINSGGRNTGMARKSISTYVRNTMGGSTNAMHRLGAARKSTARLLNIAGVYAGGGARAVEQYLSITNLAHKSATEAFIAITNFVCPDGGLQDEGIARSAYISAIIESPELASIPFENLNTDQILLLVEKAMTNVILDRITNDIGNKVISLPDDPSTSDTLVRQIKDFVAGCISDAVERFGGKTYILQQHDSQEIVDSIYRTAFDIMVEAGEAE